MTTEKEAPPATPSATIACRYCKHPDMDQIEVYTHWCPQCGTTCWNLGFSDEKWTSTKLTASLAEAREENAKLREAVFCLVDRLRAGRDHSAATLEAEVRRLTAERDEARHLLDLKTQQYESACRGVSRNGDKAIAWFKERDTARAQLATLSRCARALVEANEQYTRLLSEMLRHPWRNATEEDRYRSEFLSKRVVDATRSLLSALASGGGEGEKASATQGRGVPRIDDDGERRGNVHPGAKPSPPRTEGR